MLSGHSALMSSGGSAVKKARVQKGSVSDVSVRSGPSEVGDGAKRYASSEPADEDDDDKAYGDEESEKDGEQYTEEKSDDQYGNGDDESSYAGQEQGEDHKDEGEYDDDDD